MSQELEKIKFVINYEPKLLIQSRDQTLNLITITYNVISS